MAKVEILASARDAYAEVLKLAPGDGDAWLSLGAARYQLGERSGAIVAWRRASALRPRDPKPCLYLARALLDDGSLPEAAAAARAAIERDPSNLSARALLQEATNPTSGPRSP